MAVIKQELYIPRSNDNPYRPWEYQLITTEELMALLPFYKFSLRVWNGINKEWSELGRHGSREHAYQIMQALKAQNKSSYYVIVKCMRMGKEGREKPVVWSQGRSSTVFMMEQAKMVR